MLRKFALVACLSGALASAAFAGVVANYKGGSVTEEEIMKNFAQVMEQNPELKGKKFSELPAEMKNALVHSYVLPKLFEAEVKKMGILNTESYKSKVAEVSKQIAQQELVSKITKDVATDAKLEEEYKKVEATLSGKHQVKLSHILCKTEKDALDVKKKLSAKGSNFAQIAKEYSEDHGSKDAGGDLGQFIEGQGLVPELETKVFAMKAGEISQPIKTEFGYHIVLVHEKKDVQIPSREELKQSLVKRINNNAIQEYAQKLIKDVGLELK